MKLPCSKCGKEITGRAQFVPKAVCFDCKKKRTIKRTKTANEIRNERNRFKLWQQEHYHPMYPVEN